jgi:hypothetical protein
VAPNRRGQVEDQVALGEFKVVGRAKGGGKFMQGEPPDHIQEMMARKIRNPR